jgi:hypothetical protein
MLTALSLFSLAQITTPVRAIAPAPALTAPAPAPTAPASRQPAIAPTQQAEVVRTQDVRALPGHLDNVPVFNSNSPEVIQTEGILLSTFPPEGMQEPSAHLNYAFNGRFDLFAHHIARGVNPDDRRTLFFGVVVYNPGNEPVTVEILQAVSYLSQDAPFNDLPDYVANPAGAVFAGPGSRITTEVLQEQRQPQWPTKITIPPKQAKMLMNVPIPLRRLGVPTDGTLPPGFLIPTPTTATATSAPRPVQISSTAPVGLGGAPLPVPAVPAFDDRPLPINGRSALMHLSSSGKVHVASLSMYAPQTTSGSERVPTLSEWLNLLVSKGLAGPRDRRPTAPDARAYLRFFYGRVSGVSRGSQWTARATDGEGVDHVTIPQPGQEFSYVISTVDHNTFGTEQVQSAPMLVRYPDTAYKAHGNYGVRYNISLPLYNNTDTTQTVNIMLQTPLQDEQLEDGLRFRLPPTEQVFFRGTVRLSYINDFGIPQTRYVHVVQQRGQQGEPLVQIRLPKGKQRLVDVQLIYPPDATPPQVLTVQTVGDPNVIQARQEGRSAQ